ncbi:hypothetical protein [Cohaesibacter marisflavi]|uniref:hypothetical protein n=1 Tax=Cohaesibacter marisflavi TaxID=655353 RepID=UPI0029C99DE8|nr:hypothetical protein [Cohaesibacter marisflavi]
MRRLLIAAAVGLLCGFVAFALIGVPALAFFCPDGLVSTPSWVGGVGRAVGYGAFALWLVGTEVYLRRQGGLK